MINTSEPQYNCFICGHRRTSEIQWKKEYEELIYTYTCDNCQFSGEIDINTVRELDQFSDNIHILFGYLRDLKENNRGIGKLTVDKIKDIVKSADISRNVSQKLDRILLYIEMKSGYPGQQVTFEPQKDFSVAYAKNAEEFNYLIKLLRENLLIDGAFTKDVMDVELTLRGWNELDRIRRQKRDSKQVFVAMWFNEDLKNAYDKGIYKAIIECGYNPVRVDLIQHNQKIDDRIIAEINKSALLVADFSGHRGGVYFEAGYAMGFGLPVIWLCKKDDIEAAHFDTRQYNHIVWEDENDLYEKLKARIEATILK